MEALILNSQFQTQAIIDAFESFIWADRYNEPGDFEIYMPIDKAPLEYIKRDYYIWIKDSDRLQIIEDINFTTDAEDGNYLTITGRTLESILDRRVVYDKVQIDMDLQSGIEKLLNENFIKPKDPSRKISQLRMIWNDDERIDKLEMTAEFLGENVLEIIEAYCQANELGFKIVYNDETSTFDFSLYYGEDRSYAQDHNPWVVFSAAYDNLIGSNYFETYKELKTSAVVIGEDNEEYGQEIVKLNPYPGLTGLNRREMAVDASSVRWEVEEVDEKAIEDEVRSSAWAHVGGRSEREIQARIIKRIETVKQNAIDEGRSAVLSEMTEKGNEALSETHITKTFEGEIEAVRQYVYGLDFFIGDIVQIRNQYGKEASTRITEIVRSHDASGYTLTPTFTTRIDGDNEGDIHNPDLDRESR